MKNWLDSQGISSDTTHSKFIGLHLCCIWPLPPKHHLNCTVSMSAFTVRIILILRVMGLSGGRLCCCSWWEWLFLVAIRTPPTCQKKKKISEHLKRIFFFSFGSSVKFNYACGLGASSSILLYNQKGLEALREWVLLRDINFFNGQFKCMTKLVWNLTLFFLFQKKNNQ